MSYFDDNKCIKRLQSELNTYGKLYIAFDFDNTIFDFHNEGIDCSKVISLLKKSLRSWTYIDIIYCYF